VDQTNIDQCEDHIPIPQDHEQLPMPGPDVLEAMVIHVTDLRTAIQFIDALKSASLDDKNLDVEVLHQLCHPLRSLLIPLT
jgi:hypothetical protein